MSDGAGCGDALGVVVACDVALALALAMGEGDSKGIGCLVDRADGKGV